MRVRKVSEPTAEIKEENSIICDAESASEINRQKKIPQSQHLNYDVQYRNHWI